MDADAGIVMVGTTSIGRVVLNSDVRGLAVVGDRLGSCTVGWHWNALVVDRNVGRRTILTCAVALG